MIRKSMDMLPLKSINFELLELASSISNQARLDKIYSSMKKLINRPELSFLQITSEKVDEVCRQ